MRKDNLDTIKRLAKLTRIKLKRDELERFSGELQRIMKRASVFRTKELQGVTPMAHPGGFKNTFREDIPSKSLSRREALLNAKRTVKGYFKTISSLFVIDEEE